MAPFLWTKSPLVNKASLSNKYNNYVQLLLFKLMYKHIYKDYSEWMQLGQ